MWPLEESALNLEVFLDASEQIEHLLSASSHLRKTSNRLLSSLLNSIGYVEDPATAHAQNEKSDFISQGCEWGWGLQENWVSLCILLVVLLK